MVKGIISKIKLDNQWHKVESTKGFYLIGIKETVKKLAEKEIASKDIDKIVFEIGIDCGIKNKPITIKYLTLDFKDVTSSSQDINDLTAFIYEQSLPTEFYIRPVSLTKYDGTRITEGSVAISVNINTL